MHIFENISIRKLLWIIILTAAFTLLTIQIFYFLAYYAVLRSQAEEDVSEIVTQLKTNLTNYASTIENIGDYLEYDTDIQKFASSNSPYERYLLKDSIIASMNYLSSSSSIIRNIIFVDTNRTVISKNMSYNSQLLDFFENIYAYNDKVLFDDAYMFVNTDEFPLNTFVYAKSFIYYGDVPKYEKSGTLLITFNLESIQPLLDAATLTPNSSISILDPNGMIVSSSGQNIAKEYTFDYIFKLVSNEVSQIISYENQRTLILTALIPVLNWKIVSFVPLKELTSAFTPIFIAGTIFILIISLILFVAGKILSNQITQPISQIVKEMNIIAKNTKYRHLNISNKNEIGDLAKQINKLIDNQKEMTDRIFSTQSKLYEAELTKKETELSALQGQINPHFLYNTLDCVRGIALYYNAPEITTIVTNMSKIFRYSIKGGEIVSLEQELNCIRQYLEIISIRFKNTIQSDIIVDNHLLPTKLLKFILQPIVENGVYHGLENKLGGGKIVISVVEVDHKYLVLTVTDNGCGITESKVQELKKQLSSTSNNKEEFNYQSIGLNNINLRIKNIYGVEYGLDLSSIQGKGTRIVIKIPNTVK